MNDGNTLVILDRYNTMDRQVVGLVRSRYRTCNRCLVGPGHGAHLPLLLDEALQGRPRASRSSLLQLPAMVLAAIFEPLADDAPALASLALVNSDCRHIARCYQFAEIYFDYSPRAQRLMEAVVDQARDPARRPSIGVCVRRFIFASSSDWVAHAHPDLYEATRSEFAFGYPRKIPMDLIERAEEEYVNVRNTALSAITEAMPNLNRIVWADTFPLDEDFFYCVSRSPAREVELRKVLIEPTWRIEPPWTPDVWPLSSLNIDNALHMDNKDADMFGRVPGQGPIDCDFFDTLFQRCAPTLESLSWRHMRYHPMNWSTSITFRSHPVAFPRLRSLRLNFDHPTIPNLSSLLASPLRHLELSTVIWKQFGAAINTHLSLRELETLIVDGLPDDAKSCTRVCKFIARQPKLQKLVVHENPSSHTDLGPIGHCLIPALANGTFANLRSLSLAWGGYSMDETEASRNRFIPGNALEAVGSIESLEQLSLSLMTAELTRQWLIDHDQVRTRLQRLKKLKALAIWRDTYQATPQSLPKQYYMRKHLTDEERAEAEARGEFSTADTTKNRRELEMQLWERLHLDRMLAHAQRYVAVLPALEWMLCGERLMAFARNPDDADLPPIAVPLLEERDRCLAVLQETFGLGPNHGLWADPAVTH